MSNKEARYGMWAFLVKFGLKGVSIAAKLFKSAGVVKVGLATASFAQYAYLFTWQFAVMILALIGIHEYGHVWAMRRCGMKTKGFYFVPFFGGMAVPAEDFPSERDEAYTALMGPIWGLGVACVTAVIYSMTKNPLFAAGASWMAMVNLINLLPIYPLDGGRVLKSISFSLHTTAGIILVGAGLLLGLVGSLVTGLLLLTFFIFIGGLDLLSQFKSRRNRAKRLADLDDDIAAAKKRVYAGQAPAKQTLANLQEERKKLDKIVEKPTMNSGQIGTYAALYVGLAMIFWYVMYLMDHVPGAALAMNILKDK